MHAIVSRRVHTRMFHAQEDKEPSQGLLSAMSMWYSTQLYTTFWRKVSGSSQESLYSIEWCVADVDNWMSPSKLKINPKKMDVFIITASRRAPLVKEVNPTLQVAIDIIAPLSTMQNLGSTFDCAMTMQPGVATTARSCMLLPSSAN